MNKLQKKDYPAYFDTYIKVLDKDLSLLEYLEQSLELFEQILYDVSEEKYEFRYQPGKWTIKEVVQHLIDTERVFVYRALRFSRKDKKPLAGYDENDYVANYEINQRDFHKLLDEFCLLRRSTILMFEDFDKEVLALTGEVESGEFSVEALGYICSGHVLHHLNVIQERYL
ncbi:DinB family protein [Lutimonas zeaxanthinifaciens]|uniref:DinB family protein n=1 Tax=Lutimonas zeaxanthinifaciens TaxID=3060215 RepID=UPI00265D40B7|nr:DinB family protein [Lutimonas sp. YSD2104]WKK66888.1 DinB family protein [Lutimonas sp. YSD2104]